MKRANKEKMTEIMTLTEKLKAKLLDRYKKEYEQFLIDQENERKKAIEEAKRREIEDAKNRTKGASIPSAVTSNVIMPSAPNFADLDQIVYPNDFPTEPQKPSAARDHKGLLPGSKPPAYDRHLKPSISLMEGGLRILKIPDDTMQKFLDVAASNTLKNIVSFSIENTSPANAYFIIGNLWHLMWEITKSSTFYNSYNFTKTNRNIRQL